MPGRHEDPDQRRVRPRVTSGRWSSVCSDTACGHSEAVQVPCGPGFIEETGAAQYYGIRDHADLRGDNGIQALDLVRRKILGDRGAAIGDLIAEMDAVAGSPGSDATAPIHARWRRGRRSPGGDRLAARRPPAGGLRRRRDPLSRAARHRPAAISRAFGGIAEERAEGSDGDGALPLKVKTARFFRVLLPRAASLNDGGRGRGPARRVRRAAPLALSRAAIRREGR